MEHKIDRIVEKIDKIEDVLVKQEVNLARLTVSVEEHVKRSDRLEEIVLPIQKKMTYLDGVLKFLGLLGVLVAIAEGISALIRH